MELENRYSDLIEDSLEKIKKSEGDEEVRQILKDAFENVQGKTIERTIFKL